MIANVNPHEVAAGVDAAVKDAIGRLSGLVGKNNQNGTSGTTNGGSAAAEEADERARFACDSTVVVVAVVLLGDFNVLAESCRETGGMPVRGSLSPICTLPNSVRAGCRSQCSIRKLGNCFFCY